MCPPLHRARDNDARCDHRAWPAAGHGVGIKALIATMAAEAVWTATRIDDGQVQAHAQNAIPALALVAGHKLCGATNIGVEPTQCTRAGEP